jgi:hypothetical protein
MVAELVRGCSGLTAGFHDLDVLGVVKKSL